MSNHEWESMNERDFETMLEKSVLDFPPDDVVEDVTPWRKAMSRVLVGMALCAITLNFWCLNYILPAVGMVLSLLGFRSLWRENKWFRNCCAEKSKSSSASGRCRCTDYLVCTHVRSGCYSV